MTGRTVVPRRAGRRRQ